MQMVDKGLLANRSIVQAIVQRLKVWCLYNFSVIKLETKNMVLRSLIVQPVPE